ncbi:MAG: hypothetical protein KF795_12095 [Labilithrix sp.]|nr:hypothetical protein [Labilithrix sp.]
MKLSLALAGVLLVACASSDRVLGFESSPDAALAADDAPARADQASSACADGKLDPGEACDDGNADDGDGCSSTCRLEPLAGADTCPGASLTLRGAGSEPRRGVLTLDTRALRSTYTSACGGDARDGVARVVPDTGGLLTARIKGFVGSLVHARTVCADPTSELPKCRPSTSTSVVHDVVSFAVTAGKEYFLFMDGLDGASGVGTLDVTVVP